VFSAVVGLCRGRSDDVGSLLLLFVLLFFGLGFAAHLLWVIAVVLFVLWIIGFIVGRASSSGRHRFYRW
jgi:VIT1/CCC1 family predicted Fe2+/Mn2+ transporter